MLFILHRLSCCHSRWI